MSWARLDDGWHDHPKVIAAGLEAAGLWTMCLTWAYKARRTSPAPGVVPDAVVARFAGSRSKKLAAVLHQVRLFDAHTPAGWPIHDFTDYLPRYSSEQAAEAGRKGGSVKRTASKPLTEPLSEPADEPLSEPPNEALSGSLASARRNPVPTPKDLPTHLPAPVAETHAHDEPGGPPGQAETLLAEHVAIVGRVNPQAMTEFGQHIATLLQHGYHPDEIRAGFVLWRARCTRPSALPDMVDLARRNGGRVAAPPGSALAVNSPTTSRPSTTDTRVAAGLNLAARYAAEGR